MLPEHLEGMGRNKFGHQKAYGGQDNDHQSNPEVFGEHEDQCSDDGYDSGKKLGKSKQHTIRQNICICDNTADDITGTVSVKVREGKYLDVSDGFGTDILNCLVGHAVIDHIHKPCGSRREDDHYKNT